jgi:superfamily II DNA/RNA helicase
MTELVERVLKRNNIGYAHLNGSVPSKQRKALISQFRENPECMVFLSTDAGGVGLNLQSGSVVINMDIPWNPAVLEQRIGRVHRLGQQRAVRVINFVTSGSIEEKILELLKFKRSLFTGALDEGGDDIVMFGESQMKRFMKSVETISETLQKADPELELQKQKEEEQDVKAAEEKETALEAGDAAVPGTGVDSLNTLLINGAQFLMDLSKALSQPQTAQTGEQPAAGGYDSIMGRDETTRKAYLKIPLPEPDALHNIFSSLGNLLTSRLRI